MNQYEIEKKRIIEKKPYTIDRAKREYENVFKILEAMYETSLQIRKKIDNIELQENSKVIFIFEKYLGDEINGLTPIGGQFSISFGKNIRQETIAHEFFHSLGLQHTYRNTKSDDEFTLKMSTTNNIMEKYSEEKEIRFSLFSWQWKMINEKLKKSICLRMIQNK